MRSPSGYQLPQLFTSTEEKRQSIQGSKIQEMAILRTALFILLIITASSKPVSRHEYPFLKMLDNSSESSESSQSRNYRRDSPSLSCNDNNATSHRRDKG
ncbi:hypothetical protein AAFF_G00009570 [Aldrovandia affinis]|uniref:Uncharacterized protein n=1 Tax=Aldrovandia affinis TaxID=143900 RepID=A0AAD7S736_9TELE|nr:hypothetical protein AAFF_G00009570 [Aldrovandia affinis]